MDKRKNFWQKIRRNYDIAILLLILVFMIIGFYFLPGSFKEYLNNQIIAILIGFVGIIIGYFFWRRRHKEELIDKWFSEYVDCVFKYFDIKQSEIELRKEKNKLHQKNKKEINEDTKNRLLKVIDYLDGLDKERIRNNGILMARLFLLKDALDGRYKEIEEKRKQFEKHFKEFSGIDVEDTDTRQYEREINCINKYLDEKRGEISKIIKI